MDHFDYTRKFQEEQFDDVSRESYNIVDVSHNKHGDELLIDLVRSRPYLYDKTYREYKDMNIKENAWKEMAGILNITVSDCETRWTRLRQRYSKERILREQETRSGAEKPTRSKWFLFENLNFLGKHMVHRKSITNMNLSQPSTSMIHETHKEINQDEDVRVEKEMTVPQTSFSQNISMNSNNNISVLQLDRPWTPLQLQHQPQLSDSAVKQIDLINAPTHISDTQPVLTPPPSHHSIAALSPQRTIASPSHRSTTSSFQQSMPSDSDSDVLSPPSTCFINNQKSKKRKIEPIENAFSQINTTLSTMATQILSKKNPILDDDPDVLIGKLVTAELKKTLEPRKSILKKKFMEMLYCSDNL